MRKRSKRTPGIEEAHPFAGMSKVNPNAAGVDIGAVEIIACVAGDESTQIVKAFGNYTVDLQAIGRWLKECNCSGKRRNKIRQEGNIGEGKS